MIGTLIAALIAGVIIGALARLVMPGHQNISTGMTILLGALGSLAGSWVLSAFFNKNADTFSIPGLIAGIVMAIIFIAIYLSATGRKTRV